MEITVLEHVPLKGYTTFRIGGSARYFCIVKTADELAQAVGYAAKRALPIFILGGGSNILVSDAGFPGLVIKNEIGGIEIGGTAEERVVIAGAGVDWDELVACTVEHGLYGLENLSLIPGSVGAAPVQNIGAYGAEVKHAILWVEALNIEDSSIIRLTNKECQFAYRDSMFKKPEGKRYIITRVAFKLSSVGVLTTGYKDIARYIETNSITDISLKKIRNIVIDIRTKKLPDIRIYGTAGSFFKNPIITKEKYKKLVLQYPEMPCYHLEAGLPSSELVKIPAAWILDNVCGFKGYRNGDAGVYQNQALVIVNYGSVSAADIQKLAADMTECVKEKTGIALEREVQYVE